ncbi:MAG: hypothetical protein OK457_10205 [Thaumarchaeota archaeon]|nr:hypothetical protein [Nitrososphaerota archaeon]
MNRSPAQSLGTEMMIVECANEGKHGIPTGWYASREFKMNDQETSFWSTLTKDEQIKLWNTHFDTGRCLLCLIDERGSRSSIVPPIESIKKT